MDNKTRLKVRELWQRRIRWDDYNCNLDGGSISRLLEKLGVFLPPTPIIDMQLHSPKGHGNYPSGFEVRSG